MAFPPPSYFNPCPVLQLSPAPANILCPQNSDFNHLAALPPDFLNRNPKHSPASYSLHASQCLGAFGHLNRPSILFPSLLTAMSGWHHWADLLITQVASFSAKDTATTAANVLHNRQRLYTSSSWQPLSSSTSIPAYPRPASLFSSRYVLVIQQPGPAAMQKSASSPSYRLAMSNNLTLSVPLFFSSALAAGLPLHRHRSPSGLTSTTYEPPPAPQAVPDPHKS